MQAYMHLAGIDRAFYLAVCKDTDELYQERIHHDAEAGLRILAKAERIVVRPGRRHGSARTPPGTSAACATTTRSATARHRSSGIAGLACTLRRLLMGPGVANAIRCCWRDGIAA